MESKHTEAARPKGCGLAAPRSVWVTEVTQNGLATVSPKGNGMELGTNNHR